MENSVLKFSVLTFFLASSLSSAAENQSKALMCRPADCETVEKAKQATQEALSAIRKFKGNFSDSKPTHEMLKELTEKLQNLKKMVEAANFIDYFPFLESLNLNHTMSELEVPSLQELYQAHNDIATYTTTLKPHGCWKNAHNKMLCRPAKCKDIAEVKEAIKKTISTYSQFRRMFWGWFDKKPTPALLEELTTHLRNLKVILEKTTFIDYFPLLQDLNLNHTITEQEASRNLLNELYHGSSDIAIYEMSLKPHGCVK